MVKQENTRKNKYLTPEDRKEIEECLGKRMTFKAIGNAKAPAHLFDLRNQLADRAMLAGTIMMMRRLMRDIGGRNEH